MKNIKLIKALTVFSAALVFQVFAATGAQAGLCSALSAGVYPAVTGTVAEGNQERSCVLAPTSLVFKIYELSLCTDAVTPTTSASDKAALCQTLFSSTTGKDVDVTPGSTFALDDGLSLVEDTYTHGLLKIHVNQYMKTEFEFPAAVADDRPSSVSGKFCFSNGGGISDSPDAGQGSVTCHASAFTTLKAKSTINLVGTPAGAFQMNEALETESYLGATNVETKLYILDSDDTWSGSVSPDFNVAASPPLSVSNDRTFILADQKLATPVIVTPSTTALDILFSVTGAASLNFQVTGAAPKVTEHMFNGLVFLFSAK